MIIMHYRDDYKCPLDNLNMCNYICYKSIKFKELIVILKFAIFEIKFKIYICENLCFENNGSSWYNIITV